MPVTLVGDVRMPLLHCCRSTTISIDISFCWLPQPLIILQRVSVLTQPPPAALQISQPLYNLTDPYTNLTSNTPPHCAQLYNPRGLPWAFHHLPMAQRINGFPVWFDINLSADAAQTW